jgi:hypothetical protein
MRIRLLAHAQTDLCKGFSFYEAQLKGLGSYFLDSLSAEIDSLVIYAGIHPLVYGSFHRLLAKRFPFAVYYRLSDDVVSIYAILDCRRNPERIKKRLK